MKIAATGHRPPRLGLGYTAKDNELLTLFAKGILERSSEEYGEITIVSGMAQGWDQACAEAAILLGLPLIAALPFDNQGAKWPDDAKARCKAILSKAAQVTIVSGGTYSNAKYLIRDEWMVDKSDAVLALWDGTPKGGTHHTVRYAEEKGIPVLNVWEQWLEHKSGVSQ